MSDVENDPVVLVMGVGNTLMQDDGVGIHVIDRLRERTDTHPSLRLVDGGTIGLAIAYGYIAAVNADAQAV